MGDFYGLTNDNSPRFKKLCVIIYKYTKVLITLRGVMGRDNPDIAFPCMKECMKGSSVAVIAVRPETNKVMYESIILRGISSLSDLVYMANLSGIVVRNAGVIESQYHCQNKFAMNGKSEIRKYPEMIKAFEEKFSVFFDDAKVIGSFEAVSQYRNDIQKSESELFNTIVSQEDFLELYGQTIKRIDGFYVINYDMPALTKKHHKETDIFVIAVTLKEGVTFSELNHGIYNSFTSNKTAIIDSEQRKGMEWFNQVRRTYHISNSHTKTMFDMTDFVINENNVKTTFVETPLGQLILERGKLAECDLIELKKNPIVRIKQPDGVSRLVNIIDESKQKDEMSLMDCCLLFESIVRE